MLTLDEIAVNVWAVEGDSQSEVGKAFVRFQEFYENTELKGRTDITVPMIEQWWHQHRQKESITDSYYEYWVGFNIPGHVMLNLIRSSNFRRGISMFEFITSPRSFPRFFKQEDQLLELLSTIPTQRLNEGYVIGLSRTRDDVIDHELAHAFFALNPMYRSQQLFEISQLPKPVYEGIKTELLEWGYHPNVIHDEIQAYMSTYVSTLPTTFDTPDLEKNTAGFVNRFNQTRDTEEQRVTSGKDIRLISC